MGRQKVSSNAKHFVQANGRAPVTQVETPVLPAAQDPDAAPLDLVCFSHLRWNFVFQRPQHLLTRFARRRRVFYVEEPEVDGDQTRMETYTDESGVVIATPHLARSLDKEASRLAHMRLISELFNRYAISDPLLWYYTPMALDFTRHIQSSLIIYDCMDELSAFRAAPPKLKALETELFELADVVFTGGPSLYESKRELNPNVHLFPSSIDRVHFGQARLPQADPPDQAAIPHPRLGYFGVIDERIDYGLLGALAVSRPDWHIVLVGPFAKVDPEKLPRHPNIHYLGMKPYKELPAYLSGWDVALLPFAQNEATRFISPTKTPEYLAGGRPVVSTPIRDVARPYGEQGLVWIADTAAQFIHAIETALGLDGARENWLARVDAFLAQHSWDLTAERMEARIQAALSKREEMLPVDMSLNESPFTESSVAMPPMELPTSGQPSRGHGPRSRPFDYLVVGAGFAGSVMAERLAAGAGKKVLLVDRRPHIGGNAYDHYNDAGLLVHKYGPHIFHTNSREVFAYLSRFTQWRPYEHRVLASVDGQLLPMPINLDTINGLYGLNLTSFELEKFFESIAEPVAQVRTSEDVVVSKVGRLLYEKFFRNYTRKQWDLDPSELDSSVTARVPVRMNRDSRYFTDTYQAMPSQGYTRLFENLLDHPNIKVMLNTDYREVVDLLSYKEMIYTGPVDEFFNYMYGKLPYRSLQFAHQTLETEQFQPVAVVNYPNEQVYTRVTEFKHLTGQRHPKTSLVYEYPCSEGDPYYPIPRPENAEIYRKYKALAEKTSGVHFVGRLATYKYYNMDQVVAQALTLYARLAGLQRSESITAITPNTFTEELPCSLLVNAMSD